MSTQQSHQQCCLNVTSYTICLGLRFDTAPSPWQCLAYSMTFPYLYAGSSPWTEKTGQLLDKHSRWRWCCQWCHACCFCPSIHRRCRRHRWFGGTYCSKPAIIQSDEPCCWSFRCSVVAQLPSCSQANKTPMTKKPLKTWLWAPLLFWHLDAIQKMVTVISSTDFRAKYIRMPGSTVLCRIESMDRKAQ